MHLTLVTAPAAAPVSLATVKDECRVKHADQDAMIQELIDGVVAHLDGWEGILGRCLVTQTWSMVLPRFPAVQIRVPLRPVQSIDAIRYRDGAEVLQTLAAADYRLVGDLICPASGWPSTAVRDDAVEVEFTAGFGDPADVPADIRNAIRDMVVAGYDGQAWPERALARLKKYRSPRF